jgi:hypothetical protein
MTNKKNDSKTQRLPFFERYLEGQIPQALSKENLKKINGGDGYATTHKYPSDGDEGHEC